MKLYYNSASTNCRRVLATAYQLNAKIELQNIDFASDFCETPAFEKINPNGMLPALEDGSFYLWESNAMMQYLCDKTGRTTLYPQDVQIRADIHRWQFWGSEHFGQACNTLQWENLLKKMMNAGPTDAAAVQEATQSFREYAQVLDQHLAKNKYLCSAQGAAQVTLADFSVACYLTYAEQAQMPAAEFTHITRWMKDLNQEPGWKTSAPKM